MINIIKKIIYKIGWHSFLSVRDQKIYKIMSDHRWSRARATMAAELIIKYFNPDYLKKQ